MYKKILVPLDGSSFAEGALQDAGSVAQAFQGKVTTIYVVEPISIYPEQTMVLPPMIPPPLPPDQDKETVRTYMEQIVRRLTMDEVDADYVIREGDPASEICDYADAAKIDLIVMSTHGRSGILRWVYGSVADRVLREAPVPVLLVRSRTNK